MPRSHTTTVYLGPADRRLIEAAALRRGCGPSTYIRLAALERARRDFAAEAGPQAAAPEGREQQ